MAERYRFWVGIVTGGANAGFVSVIQYRRVLRTLKPVEIPEDYWIKVGMYMNLFLGVFGMAITLIMWTLSPEYGSMAS